MSSKYEKLFTVYAYICKNSYNTGIYDDFIYIFFERKDIYTFMVFRFKKLINISYTYSSWKNN